eukprot:scaffold7050_cov34-Attheya_sp.AAC.1
MLPPPKIKGSETKTAYNNYCASTQQTALDHIVNQGENMQAKVGTDIFLGGNQNSPEDVVTALANMDVIYLVKYGFDPTDERTMPLLAKLNRRLADLYSSRSFKNWYAKVSASAP